MLEQNNKQNKIVDAKTALINEGRINALLTRINPLKIQAERIESMNGIIEKALSLKRYKNKQPYFNSNTFFVWEPCTQSHAEVVPGYCKLLLDAGYEVSVLIEPKRIREGLFANFEHERLHINQLSRSATLRFFRKNGLASSSGILVTTAGKLTSHADYDQAGKIFGATKPNQKVLLVEHDIKKAVDRGTLKSEIITLRQTNYKNASTAPINPHYFGEPVEHRKNETTIFAAVGAIRNKRRNCELLLSAIEGLRRKGFKNFSVVIIGKANAQVIPRDLRRYIRCTGRLNFSALYHEIQRCDFLLPLLDPDNSDHRRYITTGTSGTFQLGLGFRKPLVIENSFTKINRLCSNNSVIYETNCKFQEAMELAISMSQEEYESKQKAVAYTANLIYYESLDNLRRLL